MGGLFYFSEYRYIVTNCYFYKTHMLYCHHCRQKITERGIRGSINTMNELEALKNLVKDAILSLTEEEIQLVIAMLAAEKEGKKCDQK